MPEYQDSTTDSVTITYPSQTVPPTNISTQFPPLTTCPGCGRCYWCGRPGPVFTPYPPYPQPWWPYTPTQLPGVPWTVGSRSTWQ